MNYVLVSACLLGHPVRYDGRSVSLDDAILNEWQKAGRVISICPEVSGGLAVPRDPAEIQSGATANDVLQGRARIITISGADVTHAFVCGAQNALALAKSRRIELAVLKEGSPSCGSGYIYSGDFSGTRLPGAGLTAQLLRDAGIRVFSEKQWLEANAWLTQRIG